MGVLKDIMSGNNTHNEKLTDEVYDWQETIYKSEARMLEESGAMTGDELAEYLNANLEANEEARDAQMAEVKGQTNKNIILNSLTLSLGAFSGLNALKGGTLVTKATNGLNTTFLNNASKISSVSNNVVRNVLTAGNYALYGAGRVGLFVPSALSKASTFTGKINPLLGVGVSFSPFIASQIYTRSKSAELSEELNQTITTLTNTSAYLDSQREIMNDDMEDNYGYRTYQEWNVAYQEGLTALLEKHENGELTEAEYCEKYEQYNQIRMQELEEIKAKYPAYAEKIINESVAYEISNDIIDNHYDPNVIVDHSSYVEDAMENNQEALDTAQTAHENFKDYDTGSDFGNFIKNLHATIIHYAPIVAYAEAFVAKSVDSILEFADDYIPGYEHVAKYEGRGLSEVANAIADKADAQYAEAQEREALVAANDAHIHDDVDEFADAQQEQQIADPVIV